MGGSGEAFDDGLAAGGGVGLEDVVENGGGEGEGAVLALLEGGDELGEVVDLALAGLDAVKDVEEVGGEGGEGNADEEGEEGLEPGAELGGEGVGDRGAGDGEGGEEEPVAAGDDDELERRELGALRGQVESDKVDVRVRQGPQVDFYRR